MVPYELLDWCRQWAMPRLIPGSDGLNVKSATAGDMFTALLTESGQLFLCGSGGVVPPYVSAEAMQQDDAEVDDETEESISETKTSKLDAEKKAENILKHAVTVSSPRRPSAGWLPMISMRRVLLIAGSGSRIFALQDEETVASTLSTPLLKNLLFGNQVDTNVNWDAHSLDSHARSDDGSVGSYFDRHGKADCILLAGGKVLLAHRSIISQRS